MREHPDRIPIEKCRHGWLYKIYSRNLNLGVYRESDHGFVGIRRKFTLRYLFAEFHWDTGEPYGTANPLEAICECPISSLNEYFPSAPNAHPAQNQELFEWIELQAKLLGVAPESC